MNLNLNKLKDYPKPKLIEIAKALEALEEKQKYHKLDTYFPDTGSYRRELYRKHLDFFEAGKTHRFRLFVGANRVGKSASGGVEGAYHITGQYPEWWNGHEFKKIRTVWIICESGSLWRDSLQKHLFGEPGETVGTGII